MTGDMPIPPPCPLSLHILHPAGYAPALILFFGRGRGRGGRAAAKPTDSRRSSADGFAVKMERTKAGDRVVKSSPPFSAAKWQRQKSRQSRGAERRFFAKQKILLGLDGLDRRNGHDRRLLAAEKSAILGEANKEEVFEETQ